MATLTIHADQALVDKLERIAKARHTTVDEVVTDSLKKLEERRPLTPEAYDELMERLKDIGPLPHLTREERNAR